MGKEFNSKEIATLTGRAIQDDESFKAEGGFEPERDQYYFELQQGGHTFLVGLKDLLICLRLMEQIGEVPAIGEKWWNLMDSLYGEEFCVVKYEETNEPNEGEPSYERD